jgi:hypothetical protein
MRNRAAPCSGLFYMEVLTEVRGTVVAPRLTKAQRDENLSKPYLSSARKLSRVES